MKRVSLFVFPIVFFVACQEVRDAGTFKHPDEIVNPNGDSELAIVMRNIHFEANKIGRQLETGETADLTKLLELSSLLKTAVPTDSSVLDDAYYAFSNSLESNVRKMNSEDAVIEFNSMVQTCVACHKNTCPGPIKKIQKLSIKS